MTADTDAPPCRADVSEAISHAIGQHFEIIPGRLSFAIHADDEHTIRCIKDNKKLFYFSSWEHESYEAFCSDFGPVNLAAVVRFCDALHEKMRDPRILTRHLIYYCYPDIRHSTNLVFLLGAYLILIEGWSAAAAAERISTLPHSVKLPFRDATFVASTFDLTVEDCLRGLERGRSAGFFSYGDFDLDKYDWLDNPERFDVHAICPKFLALRGPRSDGASLARTPSELVPVLREHSVSAVVRLNEASSYDKQEFEAQGLAHHDLFFEDCTVPSQRIVDAFHDLADNASGVVAVHCLAGLGRTGTLIATWLMRRLGWTAREAMAWTRIVRPGSVIGAQQHFLEWYEASLLQAAATRSCHAQTQAGRDQPAPAEEEEGRARERMEEARARMEASSRCSKLQAHQVSAASLRRAPSALFLPP